MTHPLRALRALFVLLTLVAAVVTPTALAAAADAPRLQAAAGARPVIVEVEGDAANGFGITYADGSSIYPPTDSEARAECGEYDTWKARIVCRVEVRTWYRDLADLKRSLAWVRAHG
ncbi:hypothetical protein GCM10023340_16200 [Nocardioides marinquilinus]|uniref:Uncharacterized protein n=1 Tax=Nocardioides marinquilinus TaxID=1210400 RepID=A0ABP9PHW1_9ACTN